MKYKVEYSKTNDTYRVMDGDKIVTDFATKERAEAETKRLNGLQSVKDVDKAQEKKSLKEKIKAQDVPGTRAIYRCGGCCSAAHWPVPGVQGRRHRLVCRRRTDARHEPVR